MLSEVVRARNKFEAINKMAAAKDVSYAPRGYAHPLRQAGPKKQDWCWNIYCSVTGEASMSDQEPPPSQLVAYASQ